MIDFDLIFDNLSVGLSIISIFVILEAVNLNLWLTFSDFSKSKQSIL